MKTLDWYYRVLVYSELPPIHGKSEEGFKDPSKWQQVKFGLGLAF